MIVKVLTSEPGLYGIGCATHGERPLAVATAVNEYLKPFVIGKNPEEIEDIWQSAYVSSYFRSGVTLNNALAGIDGALWDICGKRANMPVYKLAGRQECGPRFRFTGTPARASLPALEDQVRKYMEGRLPPRAGATRGAGFLRLRSERADRGRSAEGAAARVCALSRL